MPKKKVTIALYPDSTFTYHQRHEPSDHLKDIQAVGRYRYDSLKGLVVLENTVTPGVPKEFHFSGRQIIAKGNKKKLFTLKAPDTPILDLNWKMLWNGNNRITPEMVAHRMPKLFLPSDADQASFYDGCNTLFGPFKLLAPDRLSIHFIGSTLMHCTKMVGPPFGRLQNDTLRYQLRSDSLFLSRADTLVAAFVLCNNDYHQGKIK